jgi:hypothetical protein
MSGAPRTIAMLAAVTALALGADLTGRWKGRSESGRDVVLNLRAEGQKLTGTVTVDSGKEREISNGKVEGDAFSFHMPSEYGGTTLVVKGKLKGDELHLRIESESFGATNVVAKRQ